MSCSDWKTIITQLGGNSRREKLLNDKWKNPTCLEAKSNILLHVARWQWFQMQLEVPACSENSRNAKANWCLPTAGTVCGCMETSTRLGGHAFVMLSKCQRCFPKITVWIRKKEDSSKGSDLDSGLQLQLWRETTDSQYTQALCSRTM